MPAILYSVLLWALGSFVARMLIGGGLTLLTYVAIAAFVNTAIQNMVTLVGQLPAEIYSIAGIWGVIDGLALVLSAIGIRAAMIAVTTRIGVASS